MNGREVEAKLYVRSLEQMEARLRELGATLLQPRVLEINRRFDLPDGRLSGAGQVLRLRQDTQFRLTFKGGGDSEAGVLSRTELEVTVSSGETTQQILQALGYVQGSVYEKYRRTYRLDTCEIMLDELPYGDFVEIEGPDPASIQKMAGRLGVSLERAVERSYLDIFEHFCSGRSLDPGRLTFEALQGMHPTAEELGVEAADPDD